MQVAASGFGQSGTRLGYGFVAANATSVQALENSAFVLTAYDSSGAPRASTRGQIVVLLPGQRLGIAGVLDLPPGVTISRIDVQLASGTSQPAQPLPGFAAQQVSWQQTGAGFTASGTVTSPYYQDATQVQVAALAYDAAGAIVGGGSAVLDVVPARGQKTVQVPFVASGPPARVELYPALSANSTFR